MVKRTLTALILLTLGLYVTAPASATPLRFDPAPCADVGERAIAAGGPVELSAECLAMIETFPRPPHIPIELDRYTLSEYSFWKVGPGATPTFSEPGGGIIGEIAPGFNFVRAIDLSVEGWLQIEGGAWIQRETATYVAASQFTGVTLLNIRSPGSSI